MSSVILVDQQGQCSTRSDEDMVCLKTSRVEKAIPWTVLEQIDVPYFNALSNLRGQVDTIELKKISVDHKYVEAWEYFLNKISNIGRPGSMSDFPTENMYEVYQLFFQTFPPHHSIFNELKNIIKQLLTSHFYKTSNQLRIKTAAGVVSLVRQRLEYHKSLKLSGEESVIASSDSFDHEMSMLFEHHKTQTPTLQFAIKFDNELNLLKHDSDLQSWYTTMILFQKWCVQSGDESIMLLAFDVVARPHQFEDRLCEVSRGLVTCAMLSDTCVLAGGSMVVCMFQDINIETLPLDSDIDLFVFDENKFISLLRYYESLYENRVRFLKNGPVTTVLIQDEDVSIQLVACFGSTFKNPQLSAQDTVYNFDLDYIKAYYDGKNVYATAECVRAWDERRVSSGYPVILRSRIDKAHEKGFFVSKEYLHNVTFIPETKSRFDFYYPTSSMFANHQSKKRRRVDEIRETKYTDHLIQKIYPASTIFKSSRDVMDAYEKSKTTDCATELALYSDQTIDWTEVNQNMNLTRLGRVSKRHAPHAHVVLFETPIQWSSPEPTPLKVEPAIEESSNYSPCFFTTNEMVMNFLSQLADVTINQLESHHPQSYKKIGITDKRVLKSKMMKSMHVFRSQSTSNDIMTKLTNETKITVETPRGPEVMDPKSFVKKVCEHGVLANISWIIYGVCVMHSHVNFVTAIKSIGVVEKSNMTGKTRGPVTEKTLCHTLPSLSPVLSTVAQVTNTKPISGTTISPPPILLVKEI